MNVPKLRFKEFKDEWITYKFYDLVSIINGQVDPNKKEYCNLPHIGPGNIEKETGRLLEYNLAKDDKLISSKYLFNEKSVIYGKINPHFAKVCYPKFVGLCSADAYPINPIEEKLTSTFLLYLLLNPKFTKFATSVSMRTGMPKINRDELGIYKFTIPKINEQIKIGKTLELLDKKIELQSKKIEDLKLFKKGLDIKIFNNKKLFDVGIIKEYFESDGGTALEKYIDEKGTYNIISIGNYTPDGRYYDNGQKVIYNEKTKMKLLSKNNLAMILNDKTTTGDIIGSTILIDEDNKYIYNQRTQKLICKNINAEYSWCFFNSKYFRDKVFRLSQGGTQIYVNYSQIENQKIFIPKNKKIENDIVKSIFLITKLIDNENDKFLKLQKLKKGLMQNMFV